MLNLPRPADQRIMSDGAPPVNRNYVDARGYSDHTMNAVVHLEFSITMAARFALGNGVDRETVAEILQGTANAIRNPGDVAENMEPILPDEF